MNIPDIVHIIFDYAAVHLKVTLSQLCRYYRMHYMSVIRPQLIYFYPHRKELYAEAVIYKLNDIHKSMKCRHEIYDKYIIHYLVDACAAGIIKTIPKRYDAYNTDISIESLLKLYKNGYNLNELREINIRLGKVIEFVHNLKMNGTGWRPKVTEYVPNSNIFWYYVYSTENIKFIKYILNTINSTNIFPIIYSKNILEFDLLEINKLLTFPLRAGNSMCAAAFGKLNAARLMAKFCEDADMKKISITATLFNNTDPYGIIPPVKLKDVEWHDLVIVIDCFSKFYLNIENPPVNIIDALTEHFEDFNTTVQHCIFSVLLNNHYINHYGKIMKKINVFETFKHYDMFQPCIVSNNLRICKKFLTIDSPHIKQGNFINSVDFALEIATRYGSCNIARWIRHKI